MNLSSVFDVFSRRQDSKSKGGHSVPESTRNRVILWWNQQFQPYCGIGVNAAEQFWCEVFETLRMRHGVSHLSQNRWKYKSDEVAAFLLSCPGEQFLDFSEDIFRTKAFQRMRVEWDSMVSELNQLFRVDDLPYHVTDFATETKDTGYGSARTFRIVSYPRVVMRESEVLHNFAIEPTLNLLRHPTFASANGEFLNSLEDYRKGEYGDSLVKCSSALESVMKIICDKKGWSYKQTDPLGSLVKAIRPNTKLEACFDQQLLIVGTLRNRISPAHGGGIQPKSVSQHLAKYGINATASLILLLLDETGVSKV